MSLSWFSRLYHFYGIFTAYLLHEEVMSVRLYSMYHFLKNICFLSVCDKLQVSHTNIYHRKTLTPFPPTYWNQTPKTVGLNTIIFPKCSSSQMFCWRNVLRSYHHVSELLTYTVYRDIRLTAYTGMCRLNKNTFYSRLCFSIS